MFFSQKVVLFPLPSRWFIILAFVLCVLFFVILLHILVEKCNKYWSNEISEVVENQEAEEQHSFFDFYTGVNFIILISFILFIQFSLQYHLLSLRMSLLLNDSKLILSMITIPKYYLKNPGLRHYIWKKILRRSTTVQPDNSDPPAPPGGEFWRPASVPQQTAQITGGSLPENDQMELQSI